VLICWLYIVQCSSQALAARGCKLMHMLWAVTEQQACWLSAACAEWSATEQPMYPEHPYARAEAVTCRDCEALTPLLVAGPATSWHSGPDNQLALECCLYIPAVVLQRIMSQSSFRHAPKHAFSL
jgi:hypothetical protein